MHSLDDEQLRTLLRPSIYGPQHLISLHVVLPIKTNPCKDHIILFLKLFVLAEHFCIAKVNHILPKNISLIKKKPIQICSNIF